MQPAPIKPAITIEDLNKVDIRVGTIEHVTDIPKSDKLMQLTVNFGDHTRSVLAGIKPFTTAAKLYKNPHLAEDATVLLRATNASGNTEPVAWARNPDPPKHGRVFYTSLGAPTDFDNPTFQRLLLNAVAWTANKPVTKK